MHAAAAAQIAVLFMMVLAVAGASTSNPSISVR
jgi:hypothetical protein